MSQIMKYEDICNLEVGSTIYKIENGESRGLTYIGINKQKNPVFSVDNSPINYVEVSRHGFYGNGQETIEPNYIIWYSSYDSKSIGRSLIYQKIYEIEKLSKIYCDEEFDIYKYSR